MYICEVLFIFAYTLLLTDMKRTMLFIASIIGAVASTLASVAYQDKTVRFTVISDGAVRLEYAPDGKFIEAPSLLAVNRNYDDENYTVTDKGDKVIVSTPKMQISYKKGSGEFTSDNLEINSAPDIKPSFKWYPGMQQKGNLKGTTRTLDGLDGDIQTQTWVADMKKGERRELEDGILATDGWTLIDDSTGYIFDADGNAADRQSAEGAQDWYFLAYGNDYKAALKDFTRFAGKIPLPPRFAFGYWWSRYWAYSDTELQKLADKFAAYDIPLDVIVVDMDWHYTDEGRGGWTGWTWNRSLFPDPKNFLDKMHEKGLKVTLNLHPADGFENYEACYPSLAKALGKTDNEKIEWIGSNPDFMKAVFDSVLHPMEKEGVDFWWLDWQQHLKDTKLKNLDNTWWINHCFFTDMQKQAARRPMLYHRWGGLGNHRYQTGFSGDAVISWKSLEYQPYFTSTASNVLYGYWSHDIGGHLGESIDPEMYTRWLQWGAFSPVMRTHSSKAPSLNKEPWVFDDEYRDAIRYAILWRYSMIPYIYTMARKATDEGISLLRPMYYDYPEAEEAYGHKSQYMFGDEMLIAPVTSPADTTGFAYVDVWLPSGSDWYELHTGTLLPGGETRRRQFGLNEYGAYVKAGSILPSYRSDVRDINRNDSPIDITVYPGGMSGIFNLYEDAGNDCRYLDEFAITPLSYVRSDSSINVSIGSRQGEYVGMPSQRDFCIRIEASSAPKEVTVDGKPARWSYDGNRFAVVVPIENLDCSEEHMIDIIYADDIKTDFADGLIGRSHRLANAVEFIKFNGCDTHGDELASLGTICQAATYHPESLTAIIHKFNNLYNDLPGVLQRQGMSDEVARRFLRKVY